MWRSLGALSLASMLSLAQMGCHSACPCAGRRSQASVHPAASWGTATITMITIPTGEIYLDGERVQVADVPALLREREVGLVRICQVGPDSARDVSAELLAKIDGTGGALVTIDHIGLADER